jgi:dethiobiotin synthetase
LQGVFITSTGTSAGKTYVTRGLARALRQRGQRVAALKPVETGCAPRALDAEALAAAAQDASLATAIGFYRAALPLAPYAVELATGQSPPDLAAIARYTHALESKYDRVLVEGAGGLLVPIDRQRSMAHLAEALAYPLLLVAVDRLGVLSHVLTAAESAQARGLAIAAVVLTQGDFDPNDPSHQTNALILSERLGLPVLRFPHAPDDDEALAAAAISCGLTHALRFWD